MTNIINILHNTGSLPDTLNGFHLYNMSIKIITSTIDTIAYVVGLPIMLYNDDVDFTSTVEDNF